MSARWLDVKIPGGSDCVRDALANPLTQGFLRFEAHVREDDTPGHQWFYSRVIEASSYDAALKLAQAYAAREDDELFWVEGRPQPPRHNDAA